MLPRYFLIKTNIVRAVDAHHLCQEAFAGEIGMSRSHWSQILNGHRPATARVRRALQEHPITRNMHEDELWQVEPITTAVAS